MIKKINKIWWITLIIGILFLTFGITALVKQDIVLSGIIFTAGIGFLFIGFKEIITSFNLRQQHGWWSYLIYGCLSLAIGILFIVNPKLSAAALVTYLAIWLLIRGISQITLSFKITIFKRSVMTSGSVMMILGFIMLLYPEVVSNIVITLIGIGAIGFGVFQIVASTFLKEAVLGVKKMIEE